MSAADLAASRTAGDHRLYSRSSFKSSLAAFTLTAGALAIVQLKVSRPMLLAERFLPGAGWAEVLVLGLYAAWLVSRFANAADTARWRQRLWRLFSLVFFAQLLLGLVGVENCLMTGKLHFPIPAMIAGGPAYRGGGFFMPTLLAVTIVFVGPAWCSYLCYFGAWDDIGAKSKRRAVALPRWRNLVRVALLAEVIAMAVLLRVLDAPWWLAAGLAAAFGIFGVVVIAVWSRKTGAMAHCSAYCPIGWVTTTFGRISPFRIKVGNECNQCSACYPVCRYDALNEAHVTSGKAGPNCTLCGDCLSSCRQGQLYYKFPFLGPESSRTLFVVLAVSFHAAFLGLARI